VARTKVPPGRTRLTSGAASGGPGRLRLIAGRFRGRLLPIPDQPGLRPTADRVRETLFNWLAPVIEGSHCLDLFAGSGALGFEALSRGAARVVLVERDRRVCEQLRRTAQELGAGEGLEIVQADALSWLAGPGERYDVAFVDPPYATGLAGQAMAALERRLNAGARVYVEAPAAVEPPSPRWKKLREGAAGAVAFALYEFSGEAGAPARQESTP